MALPEVRKAPPAGLHCMIASVCTESRVQVGGCHYDFTKAQPFRDEIIFHLLKYPQEFSIHRIVLFVGGRASLVSWKSIVQQAEQVQQNSYEVLRKMRMVHIPGSLKTPRNSIGSSESSWVKPSRVGTGKIHRAGSWSVLVDQLPTQLCY